MEINEAILGRRSVRSFTSDPVDETTIRRLIAAAIHAPSAVNDQPWTFAIVRDRALIDWVARDAKEFMRRTTSSDPNFQQIRSLMEDQAFHMFYHAPVLAVIAAHAEGFWIVEDCALAAANFMLAAHAAGLGTCWIGFAQGFLNTDAGKRMLGLPLDWVPIAPIALGHPKLPPQPMMRKEPEIRWIG